MNKIPRGFLSLILGILLLFPVCVFSDQEEKNTDNPPLVRVFGQLLEKGTKTPLTQIKINITELTTKALIETVYSDDDGRFEARLPKGRYTFTVQEPGYEEFIRHIIVKSTPPPELILRLMPQEIASYQVVVKTKRHVNEISTQNIEIEEIMSIPGSNRDVLGAVSNMPGVNSVSVFNGYGNGLVIRGSAQEDSLITVNGHKVPDHYHFGGFESIIEPELVESIDYVPGGFSAEFGDTIGGIVSLNMRNPRKDRFGGYVNLSLLSSSFLIEGPLSEKDSLAVCFKKSFVEYYIQMAENIEEENSDNEIEFSTYPNYVDGTFIYRHEFDKKNELKITGIGSNDAIKFTTPEAPISERSSDTLKYKGKWSTLITEWLYKKGKLKSTLSPVFTIESTHWDGGERAYADETFYTFGISEILEYKKNSTHTFKGGMKLFYYTADLDSYSYVPEKEGEISYNYEDVEIRIDKGLSDSYWEFFFLDQITLGKLSMTPGINSFYERHNDKYAVDPRFSARYLMTDDTLLKFSTGLYSKLPQPDECFEPWGTRGLKPEKSVHVVFGMEYYLTDDLLLDIQAYYKDFDDMVVRVDDNDPTLYDNVGEGYAYGSEIMLRHNLTANFFGWISYTYSVSKRKDGPDEPERYFDSDIPHNLKGVISYKLNRNWSFGARYQYASGTPYTDLLHVETLYNADNDEYLPLYTGKVNDDRLDGHHQLDLRVDRYFILDRYVVSAYIDYRNIFQCKNVTDIRYNKDYTEKEDFVSLDSEVPLIFLGVKIDF